MFEVDKPDKLEISNLKDSEEKEVTKAVIFIDEGLETPQLPTVTSLNFYTLSDANLALTDQVIYYVKDRDLFNMVSSTLSMNEGIVASDILLNHIKEIALMNFSGFIIKKSKDINLNPNAMMAITKKFNDKINYENDKAYSHSLRKMCKDYLSDLMYIHLEGKGIDVDGLLSSTPNKKFDNFYSNELNVFMNSYSYIISNYIGSMMTYAIHTGLYDTFMINNFGDPEIIKEIKNRNDILTTYLETKPDSIFNLSVLYFENSFNIELYDLLINNIEPSVKNALEKMISTFYYLFLDAKHNFTYLRNHEENKNE